jgi:hypothetical protein
MTAAGLATESPWSVRPRVPKMKPMARNGGIRHVRCFVSDQSSRHAAAEGFQTPFGPPGEPQL